MYCQQTQRNKDKGDFPSALTDPALCPFARAEALADIHEQGSGGGVNFSETEQSENVVNGVGCLDITRNTGPIGMPPPDAGSEENTCNTICEGVHGGVKSAEDYGESV